MILVDSKLRADILEVYEKIYRIKILEILDAHEDIKGFKFKVQFKN